MDPSLLACQPQPKADETAVEKYIWTVSDVEQEPCDAQTDRFSGFCGNFDANITYDVVCQKVAVSSDGNKQLLMVRHLVLGGPCAVGSRRWRAGEPGPCQGLLSTSFPKGKEG